MKLTSHHIAIKTSRFAEMKAFYHEVLGFGIIGGFEGRDIVFLDIGGTTIELIGDPAAAAPVCPSSGIIHMAYQVEDVDAVAADLAAQGVQFFIEPKNMGDVRLAFFYDPDGNQLELFKSPSLTW